MKRFLTVLVLLLASSAQAEVSINSTSYKEVTKITSHGEKVKEWVKVKKIVPGTIVRYVNTLENSGSQEASNLVIKNPIPENMEYVADSTACQSTCHLSYSIDGGKTFKNPSELYITMGEERHLAKASEYTDIMWVVDFLEPNAQSFVRYEARLK